ncbi:pyridoxal phosphate-dependent decarboxylase family protein [candidate division KSB1 bacterium]
MYPNLSNIDENNLGDMPIDEFRKYGYRFIDWVCDYFENIEDYPVLSASSPGDIKSALPDTPDKPDAFDDILNDFDNIIIPGITHWNHPSFNAYFSNTGSGPSILADLISAALNVNVMLWKTSPSATELEETVMEWMRKLLHLPEGFFGMIIDTASTATFTALVAARENIPDLNIRIKGFSGGNGAKPIIIYCSDQAHSSVDKAAIAIGTGIENVRRIKSDDNFSMIPSELEKSLKSDLENELLPFAVISTIGTTSSTSIDPVPEIGTICRKYGLWHHVDGAYAGVVSIVPEYNFLMDGFENVDSYVTNPHKWLFAPIDTSLIFYKDPEKVKSAFSIVPEYLKTTESSETVDYMNYGIQLGRRFRALKLWFIIRYFGREGLINRLRDHLRIARLFQSYVKNHPDFELLAPVPFSVICFRYNPGGNFRNEDELEKINSELMEKVNSTGKLYLSHTKLNGKYTIRFAIGNIKTNEGHVDKAWELICKTSEEVI